ncbi:MAG: FAD-dependent oxidoreductase [Lachnospiraceae bacterium]|nr:FAD-dependent oxidoreductase [Lachnospiraceae bacterium]
MYDIVVVGAGPAGLTAALYARRSEKTVMVIEKSTFGGQITHSPRVENYPGFIQMSGAELGDKLVEQVLAQGAEIEFDAVTKIEGEAGNFTVICESRSYQCKAVIIATGSKHRMLGLEDEEKYTGEGISYCAVCDGAFYRNKEVAIIGGGNTALQETVMLSDICKKVTVIQNLDFFTGEERLVKDIEKRENVEIMLSHVVDSIIADDGFKGIVVKNAVTGETKELYLDGIFVAIGQEPENKPFENLVSLNDYGYINAGEDCIPNGAGKGIYVAGDCRSKAVRQVATAVADGAVAAIAACKCIDSLS